MIDVPRNWGELEKVAAHVAEIAGHSEKLETLLGKISEVVRLGKNSKWNGKAAVFWSAAGHVSGVGTFEDEILSTLGMSNRATFDGYQFLSLEKLIELHPDVIVVTQNPKQKDSWSHETLFHPAIRSALPELEYIVLPETSVSCASEYTIESLKYILSEKNE